MNHTTPKCGRCKAKAISLRSTKAIRSNRVARFKWFTRRPLVATKPYRGMDKRGLVPLD
jgi:hypothetical protein